MARRRRAEKREQKPDAKYGNLQLAAFIKKVMVGGKHNKAEKVVYDALDILETREKKPGLEVFQQAIRNASPVVQVKARRVGGATYQVPTEVTHEKRIALATRWLITSARSRTGSSMSNRLAQELGEASKNQGTAVKRKEDVHRMAEANTAFAHYSW